MIRHKDKLRLSLEEARDFTERTGYEPPETVTEYNRLLKATAQNWLDQEDSPSPEAKLLAALTESQMIYEDREDTKTELDIFHEKLFATLSEALQTIYVADGKICWPSKQIRKAFEELTGFNFPRSIKAFRRYQKLANGA